MTTPGGLFQDPSHIPDNTPHPTPTRVWQCHTCIYQRGFVQRKTLHTCYYSLTSQTQPTQQGCFQYHAQGRKGLVSLSSFLCATSQFPYRQFDWLQSHAFELISTCETTALEDCDGEVCYPHWHLNNAYLIPVSRA